MESNLSKRFESPNGKVAEIGLQNDKLVMEFGDQYSMDTTKIFPKDFIVPFATSLLNLGDMDDRRQQEAIRDVSSQDMETVKDMFISYLAQGDDKMDERKRQKMEEMSMDQIREIFDQALSERDIEKVKDDVLQMMYENWGEDWFTSREFKNAYDDNFNRNQARYWLSRLNGREITRREIPDDSDRDGRIKYEYKLSESKLKEARKYGGLAVEDNPRYAKAKLKVPSQ